MEITIKEIENSIKKIFKDSDILNTEYVYESIKDSNNLKLVIFINKLFKENVSVLYTKLIFVVNGDKTKLVNNSFLYLYDINCKYTNVDFSDINDFEKILRHIIDNQIFGDNLKILSKFIENPSFLINEWLKKNNINNISVLNIKYNPKMYITPCKLLSFSFNINVNNIDVEFNLKKKEKQSFIFNFHINNNIIDVEKPNLNTFIETIGNVLKNNLS